MSGGSILSRVRNLFPYSIGVVAADNGPFFERLRKELPLRVHRYASGSTFNGWIVPPLWKVRSAAIRRDGRLLFDGTVHPLAVAQYSRSFRGELDWEELKPHIVTRPELPSAHVYHCVWQIRPWAADWAFSVPHEACRGWGAGRYQVDLVTTVEPGEMLVADYEHSGRSDRTIVFNAHTCHPRQANDDLAGVALLVELFRWLRGRDTYYTYRLVLAPEHIGTVFYLQDRTPEELRRFVAGAFAEMPGTSASIKVASSYRGGQPIDAALRHAARNHSRGWTFVPWRQGAGNDETVWEAPGYEVPFVEVSRAETLVAPYREYHTSLDTPEILDAGRLEEFYGVFQRVIEILEQNATIHRRFDGVICLSNPQYDLYLERPDPAVDKSLAPDSENWGHLLDSLLRCFDGSTTILDIADRHDLPFGPLREYLRRFEEKGLVALRHAPIDRAPISRKLDPEERPC